MKNSSTTRAVLLSVLTMVVIRAFYFISGAIIQINKLSGTDAQLVQGIFIWISVVSALALQKIRKKSLGDIGLKKVTSSDLKIIYYCVPVILASLVSATKGLHMDVFYIAVCFFLALAIGFAEEIYFRGYIFQIWKSDKRDTVIFVSSLLFGLGHMTNMARGADLYSTLIQIVFAFAFGIVCALMYIMIKNIWPCIFIHFLFDFISFISNECSNTHDIIILVIKTVLILGYLFILVRRYREYKENINFAEE